MSLVEKNTASEDAFALSEATARDYLVLLKPRVMSLVVFTGLVGLVLAPGHMNPVLAVISILCIAVGAGASGALNMWYDADIDAVMKRTRKRPIPAGIIAPIRFWPSASPFRLLGHDARPHGQLAGSGPFWLSPSSFMPSSNDVAKAVDTAEHRHWRCCRRLSPMIGWAAATGEIPGNSLVLFMIIFLWDPAAFLGAVAVHNE
ncbi:protoheme IX farnesyltransferase [Brucella melitensis]|nr:protoheme IX farnesyltransferase [Brucella melitensis]